GAAYSSERALRNRRTSLACSSASRRALSASSVRMITSASAAVLSGAAKGAAGGSGAPSGRGAGGVARRCPALPHLAHHERHGGLCRRRSGAGLLVLADRHTLAAARRLLGCRPRRGEDLLG